MQITNYTLSLNVEDVSASVDFINRHFGFTTLMEADGFAAVGVEGSDFSIAYLRRGLSTFKPASQADKVAAGLLIAFTVDDIDTEYERMVAAGVPIVTPIETEPWGERYFQAEDPNGVILQLVQWMTEDGEAPA